MNACAQCGEQHAEAALFGQCPIALLRLAVQSEPPRSVGNYALIEQLDRGAMGVVWRARQQQPARDVALKLVHLGELASLEARERFVREVQLLGRFEHPNIVRIYDAQGMHEGDAFFTMQLIEGGSLAKQRERFRDPRRAARLVATIARAVQFCHDAQPTPVLHRDIKPENILLGTDDHPYLSDFGIAKALDRAGGTRTGAVLGTIAYMAPELLAGHAATQRSDVYSLGAVLYELLTGQPPYGQGSAAELMRRIVEDDLLPARQRVRSVPRALDLVCSVALEKEPQRRYPSAAALAEDLERVLRDEPPQPPRATQRGRLWRWVRRHPLISVGLGGILLLAWLVLAAALWLLHKQELELLHSARQINRFAAKAQADAMLYQLRERAQRVEQAAAAIGPLASHATGCQPSAPPLAAALPGFDAVTLFDRQGNICVRSPALANLQERSFAFRDYFRGATQLGERGVQRAYLAPPYRSETDDDVQFALSAPLFAGDGQFRGVLLAMSSTNSAFGPVTIDDARKSGRITVLLAPRGAERHAASLPGHYLVLVHPKLRHGAEHELPARYARLLTQQFGKAGAPGQQFSQSGAEALLLEDYRDALAGDHERWQAAFAKVGDTGYVVLVQSRRDHATSATRTLARTAAWVGLLAVAALLAVWLWAVRLSKRRTAAS